MVHGFWPKTMNFKANRVPRPNIHGQRQIFVSGSGSRGAWPVSNHEVLASNLEVLALGKKVQGWGGEISSAAGHIYIYIYIYIYIC